MKERDTEQRFAELDFAPLAAIVESSDDAILSKDLDGIIKTWNRSAERLYGYTADEIIGRSVAILMPPERPDEFSSIMDRLKRGERIDHHDTVRIHKDGHRIEVSVSISPVAGPNGHLAGAASIAREIGERKRLEKERREAADRVTRLQRVTAALSESATPDQVAEVVVHQAVDALGAWAGLVGLAEGNFFHILTSTGYDDNLMRQWQSVPLSGPFPVSEAVRTGEAVWIESNEEYRKRYPAVADAVDAQTASAAAIPLLARGRSIGVLVLSFSAPQTFNPDERAFMQALAQQCAQALDRSRLFEAERQAREDSENARRRSAFLAEASEVLSTSLDYESTLASVASLVVQHLADGCAIHLQVDGSLVPVAIAHSDPDKAAFAQDLQERYPVEIGQDHGPGLVLRTGETAVFNNITNEMMAEAIGDEGHLRLLQRMGLGAVLMSPLIARGRIFGVLTLFRGQEGQPFSSVDQNEAEDLARRCALAVDNARLFHEAQNLNQAKDEFQAMLAHELRNPIGAISNALFLLDTVGSNSPGAVKYRGIASRQLQHIVRLLDDLLDVSRITRGKVRLRMGSVCLNSVVEEAVQAMEPVVEKRRHSLNLILPPEPLWVLGDTDRLDQVVRNLVENAAKYTPDGGHIRVCVEQEAGTALVRVRDDGAGIPRELLPRIFDLFTQADRSLDRSEGGLGIGLTLVKSLAELHGGTVEASSEGAGRGSEFIVRLPMPDGARPPASVTEPRVLRTPDTTNPCCSVLLVEDNADAAETLTEILQSWGHTVRTVSNGPSALRLFHDERPDVVLLDIGLPGMDGFEVGRRLRLLEGGREVTVVALSGYNQPDDRARSKAAGFDEHLAKPVNPDTLRRILDRTLQRTDST